MCIYILIVHNLNIYDLSLVCLDIQELNEDTITSLRLKLNITPFYFFLFFLFYA